MENLGILLLSCLLLIGCSSDSFNNKLGKQSKSDHTLDLEELDQEVPMTAEPAEFTLEKGSKIIKNGSMEFEVNDLDLAKSKADIILKQYKGYFENEQYNAYNNRVSYTLQVRVPNAKFDSLVIAIENGVGELKSKIVTAKDVTEEYVDLNIRLENNLAYVKQYREILTKAKSVKEILEVQEKIRRIEEEIESKTGRLKYLDDKVKYASLHLEISELTTSDVISSIGIGRRFIDAFNNGGQFFLSFVIGLVNLWPFFCLLILLFLLRRPLLSRIKG